MNAISKNPKQIAKMAVLRVVPSERLTNSKKTDNLKVDDIVHVKMSSIFSKVRRLMKDGHTKEIVVNWTTDLFDVNRIIIPRNKLLERREDDICFKMKMARH